MNTIPPKDILQRDIMSIMDRLIARAPVVGSTRAKQQDKPQSIPHQHRPSQKTFFSEGHNGRGSKD